jgi:hypothetical protein
MLVVLLNHKSAHPEEQGQLHNISARIFTLKIWIIKYKYMPSKADTGRLFISLYKNFYTSVPS